MKGSTETFDLLQSAANHIETRDNGGATPLFHACSSGCEELVTRLLDIYKAEVRLQDKLGREPVVHAAIAGHVGILQILKERGADLGVKDDFQGFSLLHHACKEGHLDVVKYLVEQGALRDVVDLKGRKPEEIGLFFDLSSHLFQLSLIPRPFSFSPTATIWRHEDVKLFLSSL